MSRGYNRLATESVTEGIDLLPISEQVCVGGREEETATSAQLLVSLRASLPVRLDCARS